MKYSRFLRAWGAAAGMIFGSSLLLPLASAADPKVIEAAKKEGEVGWWSTIAQDQSQKIIDEFMKLYPFIKATYWRSGTVGIHNKIMIEARAGRPSWYVVSQTAPEFIHELKQKKIIVPYHSPERRHFSDDFKDKDGFWTGTYALPTGLGFNTQQVPREEAPKNYRDLLHPKWKGKKISVDDEGLELLLGLIQAWGQDAAVTDGNVVITSARFGPHYGVEAPMLLGEGGLGVTGKPSTHYTTVEDTCVNCHMGDERNHTYLPDAARCQTCHADAENFDINGTQTEISAMVEELHTKFVDMKLLNPETDLWGIYDAATGEWSAPSQDSPLTVTEAVANAMWNYKVVVYDQSMGVHNSAYTKALLEAALAALEQ